MIPDDEQSLRHSFYRTILDAIPSPVFVVKEDVRIVDMNEAASRILPKGLEMATGRRAGHVLNCLHSSDVEEGCGKGPVCKECVMRNSVTRSLLGGKVVREGIRMQLVAGDKITPVYFMVTTAPFFYGEEPHALIILEDVSELMELRELLPMCSWCGKIRDDESYWKTAEAYLEKQLDIQITHGICPECAGKLRLQFSGNPKPTAKS